MNGTAETVQLDERDLRFIEAAIEAIDHPIEDRRKGEFPVHK